MSQDPAGLILTQRKKLGGSWVSAACPQWKQQNSVGRLHLGWPTRTWASHGSDVGRVEPVLAPLQTLAFYPSCLVFQPLRPGLRQETPALNYVPSFNPFL